VRRLLASAVHDGPTGGGTEKQQSYTYDTYGNITQIATTIGGVTTTRATPTAWDTNRLTSGVYDTAGNLTSWNGASYSWDAFNKMWRLVNGAEDWIYLYTADGERVWSFKSGSNLSRWTLRDLTGKVLREYQNNASVWSVIRDYVYRGGDLVASVAPGQQPLHFHLDHLGTPRLITNSARQQVAFHAYYPFGEEATAFNQDDERMKFGGQERDLASLAGAGDDLDYLHARFYSPLNFRFLSVDPLVGKPAVPQSWNRYSFSLNSPLKLSDPSGKEPEQRSHTFFDDLFEWVKRGTKNFLERYNPPRRARADDPNVQALIEADSSPDILPQNQIATVQEGMNEAVAIQVAGMVTIGVVVGSDAAFTRVLEVLAPGGTLLGRAGSSADIRVVKGTVEEARAVFAELTAGGRVLEKASYPGTLVEIEGKGLVGLREASKSGPPTIDLFLKGVDQIRKIKFVP
jgi:RHS repeat-associated protein